MDVEGWGRLGRTILHERSRYWRTRQEFASASRVSERVLDDLEAGSRDNYSDETLAAIEATLGWKAGTCLRVVGGGKVHREYDPAMARIMAVWPYLTAEAREWLANTAEQILRRR